MNINDIPEFIRGIVDAMPEHEFLDLIKTSDRLKQMTEDEKLDFYMDITKDEEKTKIKQVIMLNFDLMIDYVREIERINKLKNKQYGDIFESTLGRSSIHTR